MKVKTDLHMHSWYSDGTESPARLVERAKALGYETIALTDHDGAEGVEEAVSAGKAAGIKVISGIEFSASYQMPDPEGRVPGFRRYRMHILGYGIDISNTALKKALEQINENRVERNEELRAWFAEKGINISIEELEAASPSGFVGKLSFAKVLIERGLYEDVPAAFLNKEYMAAPEVKEMHVEEIDAVRAMELINGAGGISFIAHPYQIEYPGYKSDSSGSYKVNQKAVIAALAAEGLNGIEAYYSTHSKAQAAAAQELADCLGLLVSRGSDDHGEGIRPVKKMSVFAAEPEEYRLAWTKNF